VKIVFLFISVFLIWWILRTLLSSRQSEDKPGQVKNMLACKYCGLHIPEDESIAHNGQVYCCREHAEKDSRDKK